MKKFNYLFLLLAFVIPVSAFGADDEIRTVCNPYLTVSWYCTGYSITKSNFQISSDMKDFYLSDWYAGFNGSPELYTLDFGTSYVFNEVVAGNVYILNTTTDSIPDGLYLLYYQVNGTGDNSLVSVRVFEGRFYLNNPTVPESVDTSFVAQLGSLNFGLAMILVILFLYFTVFVYNSFRARKPWR